MAHGYFGTLDVTADTFVKDFSPYFFRKRADGAEGRFMDLVEKRQDATGVQITWYGDQDIPVTFLSKNTADGDLIADAGDTGLDTVAADQAAAFLRVDMLIRDTTTTTVGVDAEICRIASITDTDTLVLERAYGGSTVAAHARNSTWRVMGTVQYEGSDAGTFIATNRVPFTNTFSVIDDQFQLTRSQRRMLMQGPPDNWTFQQERVLRHYERMHEGHMIWSRGVTRDSTHPGSCKGILQLVRDNGSATLNNASFGDFTYAKWDAVLNTFYDNGHGEDSDLVMLCPAVARTSAAYIHESMFKADYMSETTRGLRADTLISTQGHRIPMIPVAGIGNRFVIGALSKVMLRYVDTLLVYDQPLGWGLKDKVARRYISEFTVELHDASTDWMLAEGVNYPIPA